MRLDHPGRRWGEGWEREEFRWSKSLILFITNNQCYISFQKLKPLPLFEKTDSHFRKFWLRVLDERRLVEIVNKFCSKQTWLIIRRFCVT